MSSPEISAYQLACRYAGFRSIYVVGAAVTAYKYSHPLIRIPAISATIGALFLLLSTYGDYQDARTEQDAETQVARFQTESMKSPPAIAFISLVAMGILSGGYLGVSIYRHFKKA